MALHRARPFNEQLEAYLYTRTSYGLAIDVVQAMLSLVSISLVLYSATYPFTQPDPDWAVVLEVCLTFYFAADYALRLYLAQDRLAFYFGYLSLLDFLTVVPGLLTILISESSFNPEAFIVSQTLRVFRIFRAIRLLGLLVLGSNSSLVRQGLVLGATILAIVFAAAAIFQILDSTPQEFVPFHKAFLYMTITVIGRPPVPTHTDTARIFETVVIFVGSFLLPAFVAELARLYFEQQGMEVFTPAAGAGPHVVVCGAINTSRLKAFLAQFFHKSRDPGLVCPVVVLCDAKYEGALKVLIEQSRYGGTVRYIKGSARKPADLRRAALQQASTVIVLCHRTADVDGAKADSEVISAALAIKSVSRNVRLLCQFRRPRTRYHLACLPGYADRDRAVDMSKVGMTLVGVGAVVPGLPTLLTNLVHQGTKTNARSSNPRRRKVITAAGRRLGAFGIGQTQAQGMIATTTLPWWAAPVSGVLEAFEAAGTALLVVAGGGGAVAGTVDGEDAAAVAGGSAAVIEQLLRPMSATEECVSPPPRPSFASPSAPDLPRSRLALPALARALHPVATGTRAASRRSSSLSPSRLAWSVAPSRRRRASPTCASACC